MDDRFFCRHCQLPGHATAGCPGTPGRPGDQPAPLPPAVVSAILRDPDSPLYPSKIVVFCDDCGTEVAGEFMVSTEQTSAERLEVARAHFRGKGWQCDQSGDYCPEHADQPTAGARQDGAQQ